MIGGTSDLISNAIGDLLILCGSTVGVCFFIGYAVGYLLAEKKKSRITSSK